MLQHVPSLRFASDATIYALWGAGLLLAAGLAMWAEIRRTKRRVIDSVGWMPWTAIFFVFTLVGLTALVMAIEGWMMAN